MESDNGTRPLVLITAVREGDLQTRLEAETAVDVRRASPTEVDSFLGPKADAKHDATASGDRGAPTRDPCGIVLELDHAAEVRSLLDRVHARFPGVPTIVAPPSGGESVAAAAVRGKATDYVPTGDVETAVDRIVETATSGPATETRMEDIDEYHRILATELPDEAFVIGEDGTYLEAKVRSDSADLYSISADELVGARIQEAFSDDVAADLMACIERALRSGNVQSEEYGAETNEGYRRFEARVVPIDERIDGQRAVVWLARDITERARRERELQSRQDQLETLNRINAVVQQVIETLVEAPTQDAIERKVCEQLVQSELYSGSWIAERTGDGQLSYRTGAGDAEGVLEWAREHTTDRQHPMGRAVRTGEIQAMNHVLETESFPDELRDAAREDDVESVLTVPISHEDTIYGVLVVLAGRGDAFSESEQADFRLLGETIGFTISAVKNRQLLFADTVLELEFRIDGGDTFSFDLSETYDVTCSLEWAGSTASGRTFQYVTVDGLEGETVLDEAMEHDSVEECRLIHDGHERCTVELRLSESGVRTLANHGATICDVMVEDGVGTCLIEVSRDSNVREIAEALKVVYEHTELVARREVDRPVRTAAQRRNTVLDQLTDRQLTTLRLAYYGGFFDWPRESTGEDIADSMNVSPPTMHQHLRKGLKTLLSEFFEEGSGTM